MNKQAAGIIQPMKQFIRQVRIWAMIVLVMPGWRAAAAPRAVELTDDSSGIVIPMSSRIISYEKVYSAGDGMSREARYERVRHWFAQSFPDSQMSSDTADRKAGKFAGTGIFKVVTSGAGNYYWLRFDLDIRVTEGGYSFRAYNYYEKPVEKGITNDYSKIEYRWRDFRQGHPWSPEDETLFRGLDQNTLQLMASLEKEEAVKPQSGKPPLFRALVLYENGGHHTEFSNRARIWLDQLALDSSFVIDYIQNTDKIDEAYLKNYQLFIQLDYAPYAWKPAAMAAFQDYIGKGKGGWIGFHHATLLGEFDGYPMWPWFWAFMGGIRWKNYIPGFAKGVVKVEDGGHPVMKGVPASFTIQKEEWYTYDTTPRPHVHVIASVDESSYIPASEVKMGDHPVIWSNEQYKARNVYIFMGHSPVLFDDEMYKRIFRNAIFWAAGK